MGKFTQNKKKLPASIPSFPCYPTFYFNHLCKTRIEKNGVGREIGKKERNGTRTMRSW